MKKLLLLTLFMTIPHCLWANGRGQLAKLNLTTEQKQQIMQLRQSSPQNIRTDMQKLIGLKSELASILAGDNNDITSIKKRYLEIKNLELQIAEKKFDRMIEIRKILTPSQREQAADLFLTPNKRGYGQGAMRGQGQGFRKGQRVRQRNCPQE
jgi:Spy/CpxP family protein refolding chaperone